MDIQPNPAPIVYSIKQAVAVSTLSRAGLYNLIRAGKLEARKIGGRTLIPAASLHALLEGEAA